jgi:prolyl oligopeptidase
VPSKKVLPQTIAPGATAATAAKPATATAAAAQPATATAKAAPATAKPAAKPKRRQALGFDL